MVRLRTEDLQNGGAMAVSDSRRVVPLSVDSISKVSKNLFFFLIRPFPKYVIFYIFNVQLSLILVVSPSNDPIKLITSLESSAVGNNLHQPSPTDYSLKRNLITLLTTSVQLLSGLN